MTTSPHPTSLSLYSSIISDGLHFNLAGVNQFLDVKQVFWSEEPRHMVASEMEQAMAMREDVFDRKEQKPRVHGSGGQVLRKTNKSLSLFYAAIVSFLAIIPPAKLLAFATDELSLRVGQTLTGLLNATLYASSTQLARLGASVNKKLLLARGVFLNACQSLHFDGFWSRQNAAPPGSSRTGGDGMSLLAAGAGDPTWADAREKLWAFSEGVAKDGAARRGEVLLHQRNLNLIHEDFQFGFKIGFGELGRNPRNMEHIVNWFSMFFTCFAGLPAEIKQKISVFYAGKCNTTTSPHPTSLSLYSSIISDGLHFNLAGVNQFLDVKQVFWSEEPRHMVASEMEQAMAMREDVFDRKEQKPRVHGSGGQVLRKTNKSLSLFYAAIVSFLAIIPPAELLVFAPDELSLRVGQTLTGLLNATNGNACVCSPSFISYPTRSYRRGMVESSQQYYN
ncbi:hypothetical protein B0H14DRAFT_2574167 [Mycena olivaceomarginata]|nr:hypothetical protein B0H14DRAFT_2574167 [Mycena olivaceomarginata]